MTLSALTSYSADVCSVSLTLLLHSTFSTLMYVHGHCNQIQLDAVHVHVIKSIISHIQFISHVVKAGLPSCPCHSCKGSFTTCDILVKDLENYTYICGHLFNEGVVVPGALVLWSCVHMVKPLLIKTLTVGID